MPYAPPVHRPFGKRKRSDDRRAGSTARGYDYRWQQARERFLMRHPLCVMCEAQGRVTAASEVDHITPHRGDETLFWDQLNWQPLCKSHHSSKTASGR
jgi:5-methylcytosine-specific restriction protein A